MEHSWAQCLSHLSLVYVLLGSWTKWICFEWIYHLSSLWLPPTGIFSAINQPHWWNTLSTINSQVVIVKLLMHLLPWTPAPARLVWVGDCLSGVWSTVSGIGQGSLSRIPPVLLLISCTSSIMYQLCRSTSPASRSHWTFSLRTSASHSSWLAIVYMYPLFTIVLLVIVPMSVGLWVPVLCYFDLSAACIVHLLVRVSPV